MSDLTISATSWQAFERLVSRLLVVEGLKHVSVVGGSGDGGADVLGIKGDKRWLFQVKRWATPVGAEVVDRTVAAAKSYGADVPVIVSKSGFTSDLLRHRASMAAEGINIQLWDRDALARRAERLASDPLVLRESDRFMPREYQSNAVERIVNAWVNNSAGSALVVLATGLGKTFVAAESVRRIATIRVGLRVLVLAHTNDLLYQLERSFWPFLGVNQSTVIVNGLERPAWADLAHFDFVFASRDTMSNAAMAGIDFPPFDIVVVDECHHLGAETYEQVLDTLGVGAAGGPFLLGLTATPWRPDGGDLDHRFDAPVVSIDLVQGLKHSFLANVDYRIYTDNVDWDSLRQLKGDRFSPRAINRTLFIDQWDDAVVDRTQEAWAELAGVGKGIVFCGTVEHAERVAARINALGFTSAKPIYSRSSAGEAMGAVERNRLLWDFSSGRTGILCAVDVLNEGIDVPDVNLVVFQRVTHSRRIFVQQLGRGLRLAPGKQRVIVLDFVSDIRRFAAGLELQKALDHNGPKPGSPVRVNLPSRVTFLRANEQDESGASFLREWLGDLKDIEEAGEDVSVMRYPPVESLPLGKREPNAG
ncbi:DEAD/DEAH box helicase family protein [Cryobacterium cryoconiti]|uniref:DEAD/DEAH box helicase family protein n=1 Tax=Cryobacterium cryoconiti TaxID=1259239 RepID=UPI0018E0B630|nr:DEAD/DEAH box helicase family protein [Cryobacterium cryoconiti]